MVSLCGFTQKQDIRLIVNVVMNVGLCVKRVISKQKAGVYDFFIGFGLETLHQVLFVVILSV